MLNDRINVLSFVVIQTKQDYTACVYNVSYQLQVTNHLQMAEKIYYIFEY